MNSLGCFKDKEKLKHELLKPDHNTGAKKNYHSYHSILFLIFQKKWYTSYFLIESSENRPTKMKQKSWCEPDVDHRILHAREWITVNWTGSPTTNLVKDRQLHHDETFTGQSLLL